MSRIIFATAMAGALLLTPKQISEDRVDNVPLESVIQAPLLEGTPEPPLETVVQKPLLDDPEQAAAELQNALSEIKSRLSSEFTLGEYQNYFEELAYRLFGEDQYAQGDVFELMEIFREKLDAKIVHSNDKSYIMDSATYKSVQQFFDACNNGDPPPDDFPFYRDAPINMYLYNKTFKSALKLIEEYWYKAPMEILEITARTIRVPNFPDIEKELRQRIVDNMLHDYQVHFGVPSKDRVLNWYDSGIPKGIAILDQTVVKEMLEGQ